MFIIFLLNLSTWFGLNGWFCYCQAISQSSSEKQHMSSRATQPSLNTENASAEEL
jgi:hypothetical protein